MSRVFQFHAQLIGSKVYQRAVRSLFRRTVRAKVRDVESITFIPNNHTMEGGNMRLIPKPNNFDRFLGEDTTGLHKEVKIMLLGGLDSGKDSIVKGKEIESKNSSIFTNAELESYRETVLETLISTMRRLLDYLNWDEFDQKDVATVFRQRTPCQNISREVEDAIVSLWKGRHTFLPIFESIEEMPLIINQASYFFDNTHRIAEPGYVPTRSDILHLPPKCEGIIEVVFFTGKLTIRIFNPINDWIIPVKQFGDAEAMIYVVNIASYDVELEVINQLVDALKDFKETTHDQWYRDPPIILLLNRAVEFKEKLAKSPLSKTFPDYTGGTDMDLAAKCILKHFVQLNLLDRRLHPYLVDLDHTSIKDLIGSVVIETISTEGTSKTPNLRTWK